MKDRYILIATGIWTLGALGANLAAFYYVLNVSNEYNTGIIAANVLAGAVSCKICHYFGRKLYQSTPIESAQENQEKDQVNDQESTIIYAPSMKV